MSHRLIPVATRLPSTGILPLAPGLPNRLGGCLRLHGGGSKLRAGQFVVFLLSLSLGGCASIKTGLFRAAMTIAGDDVYTSRFIALKNPKFISAEEASYLAPNEEVIGICFNGVAKAYPLTMSFHHHIFNDEIGDKKVLVTFCPLTHTAIAFDPVIAHCDPVTFTVGGLKESNMTMINGSTGAPWVQLTGRAVKDDRPDTRLDVLFALHTTWQLWKELHPNTLVLSRDTGFHLDYSQFPFQKKYFKYKESPKLFFSVSHSDSRYHPKEMILGVEVDGVCKAYPFTALAGKSVVNDSVRRLPIVVLYDAASQSVAGFSRVLDGQCLSFAAAVEGAVMRIRDSTTRSAWNIEGMAYEGPYAGSRLTPLRSFKAFWFAWVTFHPETLVYTGDD